MLTTAVDIASIACSRSADFSLANFTAKWRHYCMYIKG